MNIQKISIINIIKLLFIFNILAVNFNSNKNDNYMFDIFMNDSNILDKNRLIEWNDIKLKMFNISSFYGSSSRIVKVIYNFAIYDDKNNIILPSYLTLYKNIYIFCFQQNTKINNFIYSFPLIINNSYYKCSDFFYIGEKIKRGIKIISNLKQVMIYYSINIFKFIINIIFF